MNAKMIMFYSLLVVMISGCAKPDQIKEHKSPYDKTFSYTEETYHGHGAVDNDFTRVYANLNYDGKREKKLVLAGEYVEIYEITWIDSLDATLHIKSGGLISDYHNYAIFSAGGKGLNFHVGLQEEHESK